MANEKFKKAILGEAQNTPPIWFMRQAGRYHSHYQNLRKQHGFMELCKNPQLAAEVALGPVAEFDFDVSILFSDILYPLEAMGLNLKFDPGPQFDRVVTAETVAHLRPPEEAIESLRFQKDAVQATRAVLPSDKSLIGFIGGPWTLFTYAAEGTHGGNMTTSKINRDWIYAFYEKLLPLLEMNVELQLEGGAEVVMIFDTSAGNLSTVQFKDAVLPSVKRLSERFSGKMGYYSKGLGEAQVQMLKGLPLIGLGYDHRFELADVLKSADRFVQGNFDQSLLFAETSQFKRELELYLEPLLKLSPEERRYWVCGLGHGVLPGTPEAHVKLFIETIRREFN